MFLDHSTFPANPTSQFSKQTVINKCFSNLNWTTLLKRRPRSRITGKVASLERHFVSSSSTPTCQPGWCPKLFAPDWYIRREKNTETANIVDLFNSLYMLVSSSARIFQSHENHLSTRQTAKTTRRRNRRRVDEDKKKKSETGKLWLRGCRMASLLSVAAICARRDTVLATCTWEVLFEK